MPGKAGRVALFLLQQSAVLRFSESPSANEPIQRRDKTRRITEARQDEAQISPHVAMGAVEFTCAEELQNIL